MALKGRPIIEKKVPEYLVDKVVTVRPLLFEDGVLELGVLKALLYHERLSFQELGQIGRELARKQH